MVFNHTGSVLDKILVLIKSIWVLSFAGLIYNTTFPDTISESNVNKLNRVDLTIPYCDNVVFISLCVSMASQECTWVPDKT